MDFTFDVQQTPLIGKHSLTRSDEKREENSFKFTHQEMASLQASANHSSNSPRRSSSLSPADNAAIGWKRPWMSQVKATQTGKSMSARTNILMCGGFGCVQSRVRECLVNLLTTCGQRVGLPKSPSVRIVLKLKVRDRNERKNENIISADVSI